MEGSASTSQGSSSINDAHKQFAPGSVMANSSYIQQLIVNNNFGDTQTGRPNAAFQQTRPRVTFADQETREIRDSSAYPKSKIPDSISRLPDRERSAHVPEPAHDTVESSCSFTSKTTTRGRSFHFGAIAESRQAMKDKLKPRVRAAVIRKYMESEFFFSDAAIPLWQPAPGVNSAEAIKTWNVCVGDVGFFTEDGGFQVLFNAFLSLPDNKKLGFNPPHNFEPYGPVRFSGDVSKIDLASNTDYVPYEGDFKPDPEIHPERNYITSYRLAKKKTKNQTTLRSGTLLDLPNGFWSDRMYATTVLAMQGYFNVHAESWYDYYLKRPPGPTNPEGHLYIVSGSYKCNAWALAFCSTPSPDNIFARLYKLYPDSEIFYEWDRHGAVVGRKGPLPEEIGEGKASVNQCVAVEVYSIKLSSNSIQKVGDSLRRTFSKLSTRSSKTVKSRIIF